MLELWFWFVLWRCERPFKLVFWEFLVRRQVPLFDSSTLTRTRVEYVVGLWARVVEAGRRRRAVGRRCRRQTEQLTAVVSGSGGGSASMKDDASSRFSRCLGSY